ncbi:hypothetical protein RCL1_006049 [Eukaryota sp. TZLM3-RCL]
MSGFSRAEKAQLQASIRAGDLHKIKSIINSTASPYVPDPLTVDTIQYIRSQLIDDSELFLKGYPVVSLNRRGHQQERLLLITSQAFYHVKYDYLTHSIEHFKRFPLSIVSHIYWGHLCDDFTSPPPRGSLTKRSALTYGVQVFFKPDHPDSPSDLSNIRTYIPLLPSTVPDGSSQAVAEEITAPFEGSLVFLSKNSIMEHTFLPAGIVVQHEISKPSGGIVSFVYNGLKLGFFKKNINNSPLPPSPRIVHE